MCDSGQISFYYYYQAQFTKYYLLNTNCVLRLRIQWETLMPTSSRRDAHQRITAVRIYNYDKCSKGKEQDSIRLRVKGNGQI